MLRDRFADQVSEIVQIGLPETCQIALFSATMPPEVKELTEKILKDPVCVTLRAEEVKLDGIQQFYVETDKDEWKLECLCDIFESLSITQSIMFTNSRERAERLYKALSERGFPVSIIHGELNQAIRQQRMSEFRSGSTRVLIATNLLARGIDVQQVSVVFNFDMPTFEDKENYIHRIGRTGRYGRKGTAINLLTGDEVNAMKEIESHYQTTIKELPEDLTNLLKT
jgi:translation initiation factor 4A